jgi:hypothetical protein
MNTPAILMCAACSANPPATGNLCLPCWRDSQAEAQGAEQERERARRAQAEALRRWRPPWRSGRHQATGHGTGTEREARVRGTR